MKNYQEKIVKRENLQKKLKSYREDNLSIATLNGSFDLLHAGHLKILYEAKTKADILIVALNSDSSIKKYKSTKRPIIELENRLEMMAALEFVDLVTYFDETDPINILNEIKPDIHINGSEYGKDCLEKETILKNGGKIHIVSLKPGLSTTNIIKKIKKL